ncbi:hypothetical protein SARC_00769 [Sphaeroforma arctica JP610]|uniref:Uncharacterized protein n=1 Tax=Sphaeroforma arctica JP610 TaxID=667725 RepID=A0A0L0GFQ0_9EUKA|nr:hypothetical protein SARC_00769 [Sphaeroforma arctica JP610]KNC87093.1 hypothetical protein SARC_00769 [Sphaeroforma arctica JP610]|eukprot:XP_014160995.1 hypothetical protein SARC_00769 [Sphaeroforma arctica JP610]
MGGRVVGVLRFNSVTNKAAVVGGDLDADVVEIAAVLGVAYALTMGQIQEFQKGHKGGQTDDRTYKEDVLPRAHSEIRYAAQPTQNLSVSDRVEDYSGSMTVVFQRVEVLWLKRRLPRSMFDVLGGQKVVPTWKSGKGAKPALVLSLVWSFPKTKGKLERGKAQLCPTGTMYTNLLLYDSPFDVTPDEERNAVIGTFTTCLEAASWQTGINTC